MFIGSIAGLHAACYGAYKDSPHETFIWQRFIREIIIATVIAAFIRTMFPTHAATLSLPVFFLVVLAWSRIVTESYKLFIRSESQERYLIPSQVHLWRHVVSSRPARILLGILAGIFLWSMFSLASMVSKHLSLLTSGIVIGLVTGLATALGGGYKDGLFEGFSPRKFVRSPLIGAFGGFLLSLKGVSHTHSNVVLWQYRVGTHDR